MYREYKKVNNFPRLPLEGSIDLTYRCNNHCRHCWLWVPDQAEIKAAELNFDDIRRIVDEARALGCQHWKISGGEPLLREDFSEIFRYLTGKAMGYTLNTNGTLITPEIARLLKLKGIKYIALYGATAQTYDHITRNPGGFEKAMRGFTYLKEAGAKFVVQLIPMKANLHEWDDLLKLAESLSPHWRVGASWLFLSGDGSSIRNSEIKAQRLWPCQVLELDPPYSCDEHYGMEEQVMPDDCEPSVGENILPDLFSSASLSCGASIGNDYLFSGCIEGRREFHIDPYGKIAWCMFIKDPALRYDLCKGSFQEAWESFIPSCAGIVRGGQEWAENCGSCNKRRDCSWCATYAFLETGRYSAPIPYLCALADEASNLKRNWRNKHRRYFKIAGITICLESERELDTIKFKDQLNVFAVDRPGTEVVTLRHHFYLPDLEGKDLGEVLYRRPPWAISLKGESWFYKCYNDNRGKEIVYQFAVFNKNYSRGVIYNSKEAWKQITLQGWNSLSLFSTDQIWLSPLLADRDAIMLHSAAAIVNGRGLIFVAHSETGKSTLMRMLKAAGDTDILQAEVLCDDRNILRAHKDTWHLHGTWSHGDFQEVSSSFAELNGIFFLEQAKKNHIELLADRKDSLRMLLATLVRPMMTADWWQQELRVIEQLVRVVPCYKMQFDKSGAVVPELLRIIG